MSKAKKALPVISELHFVSSLPLEAVLQMLSQQAQLQGQLKRWQGTMTRVDCDGTTSMDKIQWLPGIIMMVMVIMLCIALLLSGANPDEIIPFFLLFVAMIPMMLMGTAAGNSEEYHPVRMQQNRDMETLLDMFIALFKQYGQIELLDEKARPLYDNQKRLNLQQARQTTNAPTTHYSTDDTSGDAKARQARKRSG